MRHPLKRQSCACACACVCMHVPDGIEWDGADFTINTHISTFFLRFGCCCWEDAACVLYIWSTTNVVKTTNMQLEPEARCNFWVFCSNTHLLPLFVDRILFAISFCSACLFVCSFVHWVLCLVLFRFWFCASFKLVFCFICTSYTKIFFYSSFFLVFKINLAALDSIHPYSHTHIWFGIMLTTVLI